MSIKNTGVEGEKLAVQYLTRQNHKILTTNYHYKRFGEIDIITLKNNTLHFVEVKTRKSNSHGYGYEAVDRRKLAKLLRTAQAFLDQHNYTNYSYQFDIISILLANEIIDYYENITQ